jgi:aminoglycoside phosphotransferase (APT) family kinase protein
MSGVRLLTEYRRQREFASEARSVVREMLPTLPPLTGVPPPDSWAVDRILSTTVDAATVSLRSRLHGGAVAILKLARSSEAQLSMRREVETLRRLSAEPRLEELWPVLPTVLASGVSRGCSFFLQRAMPGVDARLVLSDTAAAERMQTAAAATVRLLHQCTARTAVVSRPMTDRWIDQRSRAVEALGQWYPAIAKNQSLIEVLADGLRRALLGRRVVLSCVHGDLSPGNLRLAADGETVTGLLDWETSDFDDLPILDVVQLVVSTRVLRERRELGDVVRTVLDGGALTACERGLLEAGRWTMPAPELPIRDLVVLSWLRHVTDNLSRSSELHRHRWWVRRNVERVLAHA